MFDDTDDSKAVVPIHATDSLICTNSMAHIFWWCKLRSFYKAVLENPPEMVLDAKPKLGMTDFGSALVTRFYC
jgi:hypothetical protein